MWLGDFSLRGYFFAAIGPTIASASAWSVTGVWFVAIINYNCDLSCKKDPIVASAITAKMVISRTCSFVAKYNHGVKLHESHIPIITKSCRF